MTRLTATLTVMVALLGTSVCAQDGGAASEKDTPRPVVAIDPVPPGLRPVSERVRRIDPAGLEQSADAYTIVNDATGVTLSGAVKAPSPLGRTDGVFVRIPDDLASAAAGRTVIVSVTLVGEGDAAAFTYSTAAQGDTQWHPAAVSPQGTHSSFEYRVAPEATGADSWIAILPDPDGTGQSVTVTDIRVEVLD